MMLLEVDIGAQANDLWHDLIYEHYMCACYTCIALPSCLSPIPFLLLSIFEIAALNHIMMV